MVADLNSDLSTDSQPTSYLTVYPGGTGRPGTSNLNFVAGQSIPNLVIVPLASDPRALRILGFSRSVCLTGVLWRGWPTEARGVWRHVPLGVSSVRTGELSENFGQDGEVLGTSRCHTRRAVCHCLRGASLAAISQRSCPHLVPHHWDNSPMVPHYWDDS